MFGVERGLATNILIAISTAHAIRGISVDYVTVFILLSRPEKCSSSQKNRECLFSFSLKKRYKVPLRGKELSISTFVISSKNPFAYINTHR